MPVVRRADGFRFAFFSNEGDPLEPAHVHVSKGSGEAKVWLEPDVFIADAYGFSPAALRAIVRIASSHRSELPRAWHDRFGDRGPLR